MSKPCPRCGKPMHRQSQMCRACFEEEHRRPENYVERRCPICGATFSVHRSQVVRGQGRYCSKTCARKGSPTHPKTRRQVVCSTCGATFTKHLSEIRKNAGDLHFCSPACWYEYNQGENHYGWDGGQHERMNPDLRKWRAAVIERDHGYCRLCHSQERLEVHHIKRFATNPESRWDPENGVSLCHECHVNFRNREEEYEEILGFVASIPVQVWHV